MDTLQSNVKALIHQLEQKGLPYSMPADVNNDGGERVNNRREAGHTKGNTKNQRKNMKRQQRKVLIAVICHLRDTLLRSNVIPCVDDSSTLRRGHGGGDAYSCSDKSLDESSSDEASQIIGSKFHCVDSDGVDRAGNEGNRGSDCSGGGGGGEGDWDAELEQLVVAFREAPLGFLVLRRAAAPVAAASASAGAASPQPPRLPPSS